MAQGSPTARYVHRTHDHGKERVRADARGGPRAHRAARRGPRPHRRRSSGPAASPTRCGSPPRTPCGSTGTRTTASTARRSWPRSSRPRSATRRSSPTAAAAARTGSCRSACPASRSPTCGPTLTDAQREAAVDGLAERLAALHRTPAPPDLPPIEHAPQLLEVGAADPTAARASPRSTGPSELDHVDPVLLAEARDMVTRLAPVAHPVRGRRRSCTATSPSRTSCGTTTRSPRCSTSSGPVPGRATSTSTSSCAAPPTRTCTWPRRTCATTRVEDYAEVPWWLGKAYPSLFEYPRQIDRVRIYSIAYDVRDLLAAPPTRRRRATSPSSTPTTASSGWCTARATSTSSAAAASRSSARSTSSGSAAPVAASTGTHRAGAGAVGMAWWSGATAIRSRVEAVGVDAGRCGPRTSAWRRP